MHDIQFLLCIDDEGRLYMLGRSSINEPFICRLVHEDDADAGAVLLHGGLSVGDGCGPWSAGEFEFFGDAAPDWVRACAEAAAAKLAEWSRAGRLMQIKKSG